MNLTSTSFEDGERIPDEYAFCARDAQTHVRLSSNRNPALAWAELPMGTRSLALICHDCDVPAKADDVNKEGRVIAADLPRMDFFHWVLVDLDPQSGPILAGEFSNGVTARGKPGPQAPRGARQGLNDYTIWFANDDAMKGDYYGYDGPCPPWNDTIPHHYVFTLYALDVFHLELHLPFRGLEVLTAMKGHVLDEAKLTGTYSLNPDVPA